MRKPITDPTHLKNKILVSIYVFRSLPMQYIETITSWEKDIRENTRLIIKNLLEDKVINKSTADNGTVYLRLTLKGYQQVSMQLLPQPKKPLHTFRRDRGVNHVISDHHYYNFVCVWDWITKNNSLLSNNIQIYDDSNLNNCFVSFPFAGRNIVISPDILIFQPDEKNSSFRKAEFIENDAGGETYKRLFEKIVEYGLLLELGLQQNTISEASISFVFHSEMRANQLFFGNKSIVQFFDYANSTRKVKRIPIDMLLKAYTETSIYYAVYNKNNLQNPLSFSEYPLVKLLLERRQEWKIYI